jgi:hypothetical protein
MRLRLFACLFLCAGGVFGQTPAPVLQLPLDFPALQAHTQRSALPAPAEAAVGWVPLTFLSDVQAGVIGTDSVSNQVVLPPGMRWISTGVEKGALLLTTAVTRVTAPSRPDLQFEGKPFTLSAWCWMEDATWFTIANKGEGREWSFGFDRMDRFGLAFSASDEKRRWARLSAPMTADERGWHHYAAVVEDPGANPRVTLYRDGEPLAQGVSDVRGEAYVGLKNQAGVISIGGGPLMQSRTQGALGGFEIADQALDAAAIKALYAAGAAALAAPRAEALALETVFPGDREVELWNPKRWHGAEALRFSVGLPADAPTNCEVLVYVKDWDYLWYQHLAPGCLTPGVTTQVVVSLAADSEAWSTVAHDLRWNYRTLADPRNAGIRVFCKDAAWTGRVTVASPEIRFRAEPLPPPFIRDVRPAAAKVPRDGKFEIAFRIPDRHVDPFDTNVVRVAGVFTAPDGTAVEVEGFYANDYYREVTPAGERIIPQGGPLWRVRYSPRQEGVYSYKLTVRDAGGETSWGPASFTAVPTEASGFIQVSKQDPRCFEYTDGRYYFPIGHNIRSTYDTRHDSAFPWTQRFETGTAEYFRYFKAMAENGEQLTEVWFAPWSLGLEWHERWPGYHGVGQYNMRHAWEMDRVVDEAARLGIHLNMVIHNHGKFSSFMDNEFVDNPFNADNGGYLQSPNDYFTDPRALEHFRKLARYTIARWGYSRQVLAWQLWSELDLVGAAHHFYRKPEVVEWHRIMARYLKDIDPNDHPVSTHVCGDFNNQNVDIISLPEIDHCAVDAYHGNPDPVYIVSLMKATAQFNNPFKKPVQITEYGGQWSASSMEHMKATLHAGTWSSIGVPLAGAPMLWWWMAIDEENLYPVFKGVAAFMKDVDRRDPELLAVDPTLTMAGAAAGDLGWACLRSPTLVLAWVCRSTEFESVDLAGPARVTDLQADIPGVTNAPFTVEFWDTGKGVLAQRLSVTATNGVLSLKLPPFVRDMAFKARLAK